MKKDSGFSGLEAAIVLIAFVVVAAVFSYVMLGAGFFATQKSQEVTYSGVKQSTSNVVLDGQVYGVMNGANLDTLAFSLTIPEGGQAQKLSDLTFVMTATDSQAPIKITGLGGPYFKDRWDAALLTSHVMRPAEKIRVSFDLGANAPLDTINAGEKFTIEIKPAVGATTLITRTISTGYTNGVII